MAAGGDPNSNIVDLTIHVPKTYTITNSFPDGVVASSDSSGVHYKWIVSGNSTVFGDFWIDIQDEGRKKLFEVLNFAAGALLGAAVSTMYGALLSLTLGRPK